MKAKGVILSCTMCVRYDIVHAIITGPSPLAIPHTHRYTARKQLSDTASSHLPNSASHAYDNAYLIVQ